MSHVEPSWHEAREIAHACVDRLPTEQVSLIEAHGLITTEDVKALTPLPSSAISAMDGWAVVGDSPWAVIGQVLAGAVWSTPLTAGQAVRIATGAALPLGCDGVLRSEDGAPSMRTDWYEVACARVGTSGERARRPTRGRP